MMWQNDCMPTSDTHDDFCKATLRGSQPGWDIPFTFRAAEGKRKPVRYPPEKRSAVPDFLKNQCPYAKMVNG